MNAPLRRTKGDLIATAAITALTVGLLGTAFLTAPIRSSELVSAAEEHENYGQLAIVPDQLHESFRLPDTSPDTAPLVVAGMLITYNGARSPRPPRRATPPGPTTAKKSCAASAAHGTRW